jgi:hypothetical protein
VSTVLKRKLRQDYNEPQIRILKVLYLLSENPIELGKLQKNPILALETNDGVSKPALLNDAFIAYLDRQRQARSYVTPPIQYSDSSSCEEDPDNENDKINAMKATPLTAKSNKDKDENTTKIKAFSIIGNKRIRSREEKISIDEELNSFSETYQQFKKFDQSNIWLITNRSSGSSDILNNSEFFMKINKPAPSELLQQLNEPQAIYHFTEAILSRPNPIIKNMQTNIETFETVLQHDFQLPNLTSTASRALLAPFLKLSQLIQEIKLINKIKVNAPGKFLHKFHICTSNIIEDLEKEMICVQRDLVFQTTVRHEMGLSFLGHDKLKEMGSRSLTLMSLSKKINDCIQISSLLRGLYQSIVKADENLLIRNNFVLNILEKTFLDTDRLLLGIIGRRSINKIYLELFSFWLEELESAFFKSGSLDFAVLRRFCTSPHVDEIVFLEHFFAGVSLFSFKKFPNFMRKATDQLFELICANYINIKLTEKFLKDLSTNDHTKVTVRLLPLELIQGIKIQNIEKTRESPSIKTNNNLKEFLTKKKTSMNESSSLLKFLQIKEKIDLSKTNKSNGMNIENKSLLNVQLDFNELIELPPGDLHEGLNTEKYNPSSNEQTTADLSKFLQATSDFPLTTTLRSYTVKQNIKQIDDLKNENDTRIFQRKRLDDLTNPNICKQEYIQFVLNGLPNRIKDDLGSLKNSITQIMIQNLYLPETFNFFEHLFLFGYQSRKTDDLMLHLFDQVILLVSKNACCTYCFKFVSIFFRDEGKSL